MSGWIDAHTYLADHEATHAACNILLRFRVTCVAIADHACADPVGRERVAMSRHNHCVSELPDGDRRAQLAEDRCVSLAAVVLGPGVAEVSQDFAELLRLTAKYGGSDPGWTVRVNDRAHAMLHDPRFIRLRDAIAAELLARYPAPLTGADVAALAAR